MGGKDGTGGESTHLPPVCPGPNPRVDTTCVLSLILDLMVFLCILQISSSTKTSTSKLQVHVFILNFRATRLSFIRQSRLNKVESLPGL